MLKVRYVKVTGEVTGWCGDETQFNHLKAREGEATVNLDIPIPLLRLRAYLIQNKQLISNPDYIPPVRPEPFEPLNPNMSAAKRLAHIEEYLKGKVIK